MKRDPGMDGTGTYPWLCSPMLLWLPFDTRQTRQTHPLVNPGNPVSRLEAGSTADTSNPHPCMVKLPPCPPSHSLPSPSQTKNATVVLEHPQLPRAARPQSGRSNPLLGQAPRGGVTDWQNFDATSVRIHYTRVWKCGKDLGQPRAASGAARCIRILSNLA